MFHETSIDIQEANITLYPVQIQRNGVDGTRQIYFPAVGTLKLKEAPFPFSEIELYNIYQYIHSSICLQGVVLNKLRTVAIIPF
jgi:hypothetical protein